VYNKVLTYIHSVGLCQAPPRFFSDVSTILHKIYFVILHTSINKSGLVAHTFNYVYPLSFGSLEPSQPVVANCKKVKQFDENFNTFRLVLKRHMDIIGR
jgi:hypothetical protein